MTATTWNFDDDDDAAQTPPAKPKNGLRDHVKSLETQLAEAKAANAALVAAARTTTIADVLKAKGFDRRIAALVPAGIDPTVDAVTKWVDEYADLFGAKTATDGPEGADDDGGADAEEAAAYGRIGRSTAGGAAPGKDADLLKKLGSKDLTQAELLDLIQGA